VTAMGKIIADKNALFALASETFNPHFQGLFSVSLSKNPPDSINSFLIPSFITQFWNTSRFPEGI